MRPKSNELTEVGAKRPRDVVRADVQVVFASTGKVACDTTRDETLAIDDRLMNAASVEPCRPKNTNRMRTGDLLKVIYRVTAAVATILTLVIVDGSKMALHQGGGKGLVPRQINAL